MTKYHTFKKDKFQKDSKDKKSKKEKAEKKDKRFDFNRSDDSIHKSGGCPYCN